MAYIHFQFTQAHTIMTLIIHISINLSTNTILHIFSILYLTKCIPNCNAIHALDITGAERQRRSVIIVLYTRREVAAPRDTALASLYRAPQSR